MDEKIVEIDGKYYLELPCRPGDTVYRVMPHVKTGVCGLCVDYEIVDETLINIESVIDFMCHKDKHVFLTLYEAVVHKDLLEKGLED